MCFPSTPLMGLVETLPQDTAATAMVDSAAVVAPRRRKESGPSPLLEDPEDRWIGMIGILTQLQCQVRP